MTSETKTLIPDTKPIWLLRAIPVHVDAGAGPTGVAAADTAGRPAAQRLALVADLHVVLDADGIGAEDEPAYADEHTRTANTNPGVWTSLIVMRAETQVNVHL